MSQAASQASIFFEQVVREGRVFTFLDEGHRIALGMSTGEVVPWWSSRTRVVKVQKDQAKYREFSIDEISLEAFLNEVLPGFHAEGVRIGVNWSGPRLTGFDYSVEDVRRNLGYWIEKLQPRP